MNDKERRQLINHKIPKRLLKKALKAEERAIRKAKYVPQVLQDYKESLNDRNNPRVQ